MKILAVVVFVLLSVGFYIAILDNAEPSSVGKKPSDEQVFYTQERNKVTGELLNIQITRCLICNAVISYVQFSLNGKVRTGHYYQHRCGRYLVRYNGSGLWDVKGNFIEWLESWQKRLRLRR